MQGISWFLIKSWYYWNTSSLKPKLTSQKKTVILAWLFQSPNNYWESTVPSYKMLNFIQLDFTNHYFHKDHNTPWFLPHPHPPPPPPPPPHQFSKPVSLICPGYYSHPKRNRTQWLWNFFLTGGRGWGWVNKVHYALCKNGELFLFLGEKVHYRKVWISLCVPKVTNINFRLTISMHYQEKKVWELINWSTKEKCFDSLRKCMEISLENLLVDIGNQRDMVTTFLWKRIQSAFTCLNAPPLLNTASVSES